VTVQLAEELMTVFCLVAALSFERRENRSKPDKTFRRKNLILVCPI